MAENGRSSIYERLLLFGEIIVLLIRVLLIFLRSLFHCFVPRPEKSVTNDKILITGTGHGIGKELARQYGNLGATIVCVDVNAATNKETVSELRRNGVKAFAFECDVSRRENVMELGKKVKAEVGDITILVHNAGIMPTMKLAHYTPNVIHKIFGVNVFALFWLMDAFVPDMLKKNYGHIVSLSSVAGIIGFPNLVPYCGSKFAVRGLMEASAEEYRQMGKNIHFTTVYPCVTDTGLCKKPRIRFPNVLGIQKPQLVAKRIIEGQRRGYREVMIPSWIMPVQNVARVLPERAQELLVDFCDTGLDL